jgi:hypothetical protein
VTDNSKYKDKFAEVLVLQLKGQYKMRYVLFWDFTQCKMVISY